MRQALLLCCIFLSANLFGQSYTFSVFSIEEGLTQSQVTAVCEDHHGYLWVGTLGGLNSFNGSSFKNYAQKDGLLNNRITALRAHNDQLWIGHEDGISLFQKQKFRSWTFPKSNSGSLVSDILVVQNQVVAASNGGGLYVLKNNAFKSVPLANEDQRRIRHMVWHQNRLYLATRDGLLVSDDLTHFRKVDEPFLLNLTDVAVYNNGLLLTDTDGRLFQYDPESGKVRLAVSLSQNVFINDCHVDEKGDIWLTSEMGLTHLDKHFREHIIDENNGLPYNVTSCVYEDHNNTLWIGSEGKGLFRFAGTHITYYNKKTGFGSDLVTAVLELRNGAHVFGTYDNGLIRLQNGTYSRMDLPNNTIWALHEDHSGNLWAGTSNGLYRIDGKKPLPIIRDEKISCFLAEKSGSFLVGGTFGVMRVRQQEAKPVALSNQQVGTIRKICLRGSSVLCAADGGVFELKNGSFVPFLDMREACNTIYTDPSGSCWIGSENGLFVSKGNKINRLVLSDQPAADVINFIQPSGQTLLIGTNNGVYQLSNIFNYRQLHIRYLGTEEGLINLETNYNSSFVNRDGVLWFGTAEGLMRLKLGSAKLMQPENKPNLQFTDIRINFQAVDLRKYAQRFGSDGFPEELVLPPTKNNLILELDGIALRHHKSLKYTYWLEDLDEGWSPAFSSPVLTLTNLPSGSYTLHIRAVNQEGNYSAPLLLKLVIQPHFYRTWWFYSLNGLLFLLLVYGIFRYRLNREREKQYKESLEFKAKLMLLEQQSLNASMNRHFIFNSLNSIQYFINTQDKHSANKYLTNFAKLIRKNLDSSSENNNMIPLNQEIERLELYLSLEAMRFKDRFDYVIDTDDVDLETIMVPSMLFQPFVENSIIHGVLPLTERKGLIEIRLWLDKDILHVLIQDNGIGIENSLSKKARFEGDHQSKGMEITTKRIDLLKKISQQEYEMEGPEQLPSDDRSLNGTRVLIKIPVENLVD